MKAKKIPLVVRGWYSTFVAVCVTSGRLKRIEESRNDILNSRITINQKTYIDMMKIYYSYQQVGFISEVTTTCLLLQCIEEGHRINIFWFL